MAEAENHIAPTGLPTKIMEALSVVIITKNEAANIAECIRCAKFVTDDVVVTDSGSTDDTVALARAAGASVIATTWSGYGHARNLAAESAKYDWILAIDADERVTYQLAAAVKSADGDLLNVVYGFKRENYFLGRRIRFGAWGRDKVYRLYNRKNVSWDLSSVHEDLTGDIAEKKLLHGRAQHFTVITPAQNMEKVRRYARLSAAKMYGQKREAGFVKRYLSPLSAFLQTYVLQLGFLDGRYGWVIAMSVFENVRLKYKYLYLLNSDQPLPEP